MKSMFMKWAGLSLALFLWNCSMPNPAYLLGKTTPKGKLNAGFLSVVSLPAETIKNLGKGSLATLQFIGADTLGTSNDLEKVQNSILAFSLQPFTIGYEFYLRYGLFRNMDIGYKFVSDKHAFDVRYQFLGKEGNLMQRGEVDGSIGLQYSRFEMDFPDEYDLKEVQAKLKYQLRKNEFYVPLSLSRDFMQDLDIGGIGTGVVFGLANIDYSFGVATKNTEDGTVTDPISFHKWYPSFGGFLNLKLGYKFIFANASIAFINEKIGKVRDLNGEWVEMGGTNIIPAVGLQFFF